MISNAVFITTMACLALGLFVMGELQFLAPYRRLLADQYALAIASYVALFFFNVLAAVLSVVRTLLLKETGRKLAHLERQLEGDLSGSVALARRNRK